MNVPKRAFNVTPLIDGGDTYTRCSVAYKITEICVNFLYSSARACIISRQIEPRSSRLATFVAGEQGYLPVHFARLGSLVVIVFSLGPGRHFFSNRTEHGYRAFFDRQPPILTARIDRVLAVLDQKDRPVAQKMRTGLYYFELLVLGKNRLKFFVLIYSA